MNSGGSMDGAAGRAASALPGVRPQMGSPAQQVQRVLAVTRACWKVGAVGVMRAGAGRGESGDARR